MEGVEYIPPPLLSAPTGLGRLSKIWLVHATDWLAKRVNTSNVGIKTEEGEECLTYKGREGCLSWSLGERQHTRD